MHDGYMWAASFSIGLTFFYAICLIKAMQAKIGWLVLVMFIMIIGMLATTMKFIETGLTT